jgi:hypothetical protein
MDLKVFNVLVKLMGYDNGVVFFPTFEYILSGRDAVARMRAAGVQWPQNVELESENPDSILWRIAAGEDSEMHEEFNQYDGFKELFHVLSLVFNGECSR